VRPPIYDDGDLPQPQPQRALRIFITTTLGVGGILVGILVVRETLHPSWLAPRTAPAPAATLGGSVVPPLAPSIALPSPTATATQPAASASSAPPSVVASVDAGPSTSASAVASAGAHKPRSPAAGGRPAEPAVVELPDDYRYSPAGSANLTFPR
jgi:hypothetical protein